jgi:integral membrane protein
MTLSQHLNRPANWKFFTDTEAWSIFRLAAFGEAIGWTLLISGIVIGKYLTPGNGDAVMIAGQLHGFLFFVYISAAISTAGSFSWSLRKTAIAGLMSIPPYGTLLFEKYEAHKRLHAQAKQARRISVWALIGTDQKLLVVQAKDNSDWQVPGTQVRQNQSIETALTNHLLAAFNVRPVVRSVAYIRQSQGIDFDRLEFYITIDNGIDFIKKIQPNTEYDEVRLVVPRKVASLQPAFLQTVSLKKLSDQPTQLLQQ